MIPVHLLCFGQRRHLGGVVGAQAGRRVAAAARASGSRALRCARQRAVGVGGARALRRAQHCRCCGRAALVRASPEMQHALCLLIQPPAGRPRAQGRHEVRVCVSKGPSTCNSTWVTTTARVGGQVRSGQVRSGQVSTKACVGESLPAPRPPTPALWLACHRWLLCAPGSVIPWRASAWQLPAPRGWL